MVGKWHLGHKRPQWQPTRRGFGDYLGILYSNDMRPVRLLDGERVVEYPLVQATLTRRYTEEAVQFLTANKGRPFFLYLPYAMPHVPLFRSGEFAGRSARGLFGDVVEEIDWSVGQVLGALRKEGLAENTLVAFTSDNGPWLIFDQ